MKYSQADEDFDLYYILKIFTEEGEKYFFRPNVFVSSVGLAKKFNTIRSVRRSIKLCGTKDYSVEIMKRES